MIAGRFVDQSIKLFSVRVLDWIDRIGVLEFSVKCCCCLAIGNAFRAQAIGLFYGIQGACVFDKCWFLAAVASLGLPQLFEYIGEKWIGMVAECGDFLETFVLA